MYLGIRRSVDFSGRSMCISLTACCSAAQEKKGGGLDLLQDEQKRLQAEYDKMEVRCRRMACCERAGTYK